MSDLRPLKTVIGFVTLGLEPMATYRWSQVPRVGERVHLNGFIYEVLDIEWMHSDAFKDVEARVRVRRLGVNRK